MQRFTWDNDGFPVFGEPLPADTALPKPSGTPVIKKVYRPASNNITTTWGDHINPDDVLSEYPRPQLVRDRWQNLNGLWQYAIREDCDPLPRVWDGDILVPFCLESSLSGVGKTLPYRHTLWYHRTFTIPRDWHGQNIVLNFGAVDWQARVYVNGTESDGLLPETPYLQCAADCIQAHCTHSARQEYCPYTPPSKPLAYTVQKAHMTQ